MADKKEKPRTLLPAAAAAGVQRAVRTWLNTCPELPADIRGVSFEDLQENESGICFATIQSPVYAERYILGGYKAEYRFRIIYRVLPTDDGDMLDAVETLAAVGAWCESADPPELTGAVNEHVSRTSDAAILAAYDDGCSDYSMDMTFSWEVFK